MGDNFVDKRDALWCCNQFSVTHRKNKANTSVISTTTFTIVLFIRCLLQMVQ